jgi:thiol-disulfide isomerase/thioredoxin
VARTHLVAGLTLLTLGCSEPPTQEAATPADPAVRESVQSTTIDWYRGSLDSAFAEAVAADKPVLLYWGAEWCPPCHQLKVTIFKERNFIDRSRLFVPVYLDGDTASAQKYAERFGVVGYPTMVVLSPQAKEITRIAGGIDIDAYGHVLDAAVGQGESVKDLVAAVVAGTTLSPAACRLIAYYSWAQDNQQLLKHHAGTALFPLLESACPLSLATERARLFTQSLRNLAADDSRSLDEVQRSALNSRLQGLLGDGGLARADLEFTILEAANTAELTTSASGAAREQLVALWQQVLTQLRDDDALPKRERIYTLAGQLRLQRLGAADDAPPLPELAAEIRRVASWADADTPDPYERQTVMNAVANTLWEAGFYEDARQMLSKERRISKYPCYFTLTLAELEQDAGNAAEALNWFHQAYQEAEGQATRFQWGFNYLVALMDVVPEDEARIEAETLRVFDELKENAPDAFYQRTRQRLEVLTTRFAEWNEAGKHRQSMAVIRRSVGEICATIEDGNASRANCEAFLDPLQT